MSHLVLIFEIEFSVYKQTTRHHTEKISHSALQQARLKILWGHSHVVALLNDVTLSLATRHDLYLPLLIAAVLGCNFCNFSSPRTGLGFTNVSVKSQLNHVTCKNFSKRWDWKKILFHYVTVHNLITYNPYHSVQLLVCCHLRYITMVLKSEQVTWY